MRNISTGTGLCVVGLCIASYPIIDGTNLGLVLANWGPQTPCAPEATYPCLTLNQPLLK